MKRSALPLPRYVLRKPLKAAAGDISSICRPGRARQVARSRNEPLGTDYAAGRAARRDGAAARLRLVAQRRQTDTSGGRRRPARSTGCSPSTAPTADTPSSTCAPSATTRSAFASSAAIVMKDGRRLGTMPLASITTAVTDALYEKLLIVTETDAPAT